MLREPLQWTPRSRRGMRSRRFKSLQAALRDSRDVLLFKTDRSLGKLTGRDYDRVTDQAQRCRARQDRAAQSLLPPPLGARTGVRRSLVLIRAADPLDRSRAVYGVRRSGDGDARPSDSTITSTTSADYEKRTPARIHRGNVPPSISATHPSMVSIKSTHSNGQLPAHAHPAVRSGRSAARRRHRRERPAARPPLRPRQTQGLGRHAPRGRARVVGLAVRIDAGIRSGYRLT